MSADIYLLFNWSTTFIEQIMTQTPTDHGFEEQAATMEYMIAPIFTQKE